MDKKVDRRVETSGPSVAPAGADLSVFYDGGCPLCTAEIAFYRRRRGAERVDWIDITTCPAGDVAPGLSRDAALRRFHARDRSGRLINGGAAFAAVWSILPGFQPLGRLFRRQPFAWLIDRAYDAFLPLRPAIQHVVRRLSRTTA